MIDLHCHILHAVDDGPHTLQQSIQLARVLIRAGYHTVAATPHMVPGTPWMPTIDMIDHRISELKTAISGEQLPLRIKSGMEIALDPAIVDLLDENRLIGLGDSSCLLIELPFLQLPAGWEQMIAAIQSTGCAVLLAHPERCQPLAADHDQIARLIDSGVLTQINWGSLMGIYGRSAARAATQMAVNGWITCLASDSHHADHRYPARLREAFTSLMKRIGVENLKRITVENPLRLLNGEGPRPMMIRNHSVAPPKKRWRWFGLSSEGAN